VLLAVAIRLHFRGARGGESEASQARDQAGRSIGEGVERGYVFFRVVHVCSGIILTALAIYLEGSFNIINDSDGRKLLDLLIPYLIFAFTMLIFFLRKLKYAAVDGLVSFFKNIFTNSFAIFVPSFLTGSSVSLFLSLPCRSQPTDGPPGRQEAVRALHLPRDSHTPELRFYGFKSLTE
jgi:hypothetical protein